MAEGTRADALTINITLAWQATGEVIQEVKATKMGRQLFDLWPVPSGYLIAAGHLIL